MPTVSTRCVSRGDYPVNERTLLNLPPRPAPPGPPERIVVEEIRGDKISYVVFTGDNVRLAQERAVRDTLPAGSAVGGATAQVKKRCPKCEARRGKRRKRRGARVAGAATAGHDAQPQSRSQSHTRARGGPDAPPPESGPGPSRTT